MIYFDELAIAKEMESANSQVDEYKKSDVLLYAKYLRYKKLLELGIDYEKVTINDMTKIDNQIEKELISFCENYYIDFNYIVKFQDIDMAVERSRHYKLKLPLPTPITQKEWEAICTVENDNYRRMIFVMLVDAKYNRLHSTAVENNVEIDEDTLFYCRMKKTEIYKAGGCKFKDAEEKRFSLGCLYDAGLFDITDNKFRSWFVKFVDLSSGVYIDYITDYDHLKLHYEKLCGSKIGKCDLCGKLFKQSERRPSKLCYKHRGYNKKQEKAMRTGVCVDCGSEFTVVATDKNKCRCDNCQKEYRKQYKHLKYLSGKN